MDFPPRPSASWSAVAAAGARALEAAGWTVDQARRDAVLLARHACRWDAAEWLTRSHEPADRTAVARFEALIARRAAHEPIAYLLGKREFYGRDFLVTPAVLIPRPETELIVDEVLPADPRPSTIVDACTGSGCLAVTLALECPAARVTATDVSAAALDVARRNARRHGVEDRIAFVESSLLAGVPGPADVVVANPPYVAMSDRGRLPREVADFEPPVALFGGADGLLVIRQLVAAAPAALAEGGRLILEIGQGQADAVSGLVRTTPGLQLERIRTDLQGIPRVVVARRE